VGLRHLVKQLFHAELLRKTNYERMLCIQRSTYALDAKRIFKGAFFLPEAVRSGTLRLSECHKKSI
jgi:hypothetical protein